MCDFAPPPAPQTPATIDLVGLPLGVPLDFLSRHELLMRRQCVCGVMITVSILQFERALRLPGRGRRRIRAICLDCATRNPELIDVVNELRQLIAKSLAAQAAANHQPKPSQES